MRGFGTGFLSGIVLAILALAALDPVMRGPDAGAPHAAGDAAQAAPEAPAPPKAEAEAPEAEVVPEGETALEEPESDEAASAPAQEPAPAPPAQPAAEPEAEPAAGPQPTAPSDSAAGPAPAATAEPADPAPEATAEPAPKPAPELPAEPAPSDVTGDAEESAPALPVEAPSPGRSGEAPAPAAENATPGQDATESAGATLGSAPPLGDQAEGVTTDRLPRIGDAPTESPAGIPAAPEAATGAASVVDLPPLLAEARPFEADPALPRLAVILIDIGAAGLPRDDLARLPFAVTFAIDPLAPDAAQAAAAYRAAGQEVVLLAPPLPEGATPADLETAIEAAGLALPQAVAMLERPAALGSERRLAAQAVPILKAQGRGLVTHDAGLGSAAQAAQREGLPHAEVYRLLDAGDETAPVILRYLDRAAFTAKQEGQVVVLGRSRPETVAALVQWMTAGQGATLAIAPLTALMGPL